MPNAFTHYWQNDTWQHQAEDYGTLPLNHVAGNGFIRRGVDVGDSIYVVTNLRGKMYLAARLTVGRIVGQAAAERELKMRLWDASEHVIASAWTPARYDLQVPDEVVRQLRFGDSGEPLRFAAPGVLDQQTLRGVRRLAPESARLLDRVLAGTGPAEDAVAEVNVDADTVPHLHKVRTLDDLADNFIRFQQGARRHRDLMQRPFWRTEYWVRDANSGAFGPGKFLGYRGMDFETYARAVRLGSRGAKFNGGTARLAIEEAAELKFARDETLDDDLRAWGEALVGPGVFGGASSRKWKYMTLPVPGREPVTGFPDEVPQPDRYFEGATRTVSVNVYERDRAARAECIRHYGPRCAVCGLEFAAVYGEAGAGFIHVHHLRPLAGIGEQYQVDPVNDLRPVCPNCHAMLHTQSPPLEIEELQRRMATAAAATRRR